MAQLNKKFLKNDSVGGSKILIENDTYVRVRNAANSADVNTLKVNASDRIEFASVPQVSADAASANDLVRYSQFAGAIEGMKPKASVACVSVSGIDLSVASTPNPVEGHTLLDGERILLADQPYSYENGIYVAVTAADPTSYVRASDFNAVSEIPGSYTAVQFGLYAGVIFLTTSTPAVLGVDPIEFIKKATASASNQEVQFINLDATDISNQYVDLVYPALGSSDADNSVSLSVIGGISQHKTVDYSVSLTGGALGVTRITFLNDLATGGASELNDTDFLEVSYSRI